MRQAADVGIDELPLVVRRSTSSLYQLLRNQGNGPGRDLGPPQRLPQRLQVTHSLLLYLEHDGEARHVPPVLKSVEVWLLSSSAVPDEPQRPGLYLVKEREVRGGRPPPPCKARVLQSGTNLCLVEDIQPLTIKQPGDPPQGRQLPRGFSGQPLDVCSEGQPVVVSDPQHIYLVL